MLEFSSARNLEVENTNELNNVKTLISILTAILRVLWATHQKWHFTQFRFKQASTGHDTFSPVNDADFLIFSLSLKYARSRFFYEGFKISAFNRLTVLFWNHALIASGSMDSLRETQCNQWWYTLIALADVLPDSPADFTIDSIAFTLTDWRDWCNQW